MSLKNKIINGIIEVEGGYVNHESDRGKATKFGITEKEARNNGYTGDMRDLPRELAYQIYAVKYWDVNNLSQIAALSEKVATEVADTGVNMGVGVAARFLQRSLNCLNMKGKLYTDLVVDGLIGAKTINALDEFLKFRGEERGTLVLLRMLNSLQGAYYIDITESREQNEDFIFGWFLHRVVI